MHRTRNGFFEEFSPFRDYVCMNQHALMQKNTQTCRLMSPPPHQD